MYAKQYKIRKIFQKAIKGEHFEFNFHILQFSSEDLKKVLLVEQERL